MQLEPLNKKIPQLAGEVHWFRSLLTGMPHQVLLYICSLLITFLGLLKCQLHFIGSVCSWFGHLFVFKRFAITKNQCIFNNMKEYLLMFTEQLCILNENIYP